MSCLKQFTLVAVLRLLGSLFKVLGPTCDKLCIPNSNFDLQKGNFSFLSQQHVATPLSSTGQKTYRNYSSQDTYVMLTGMMFWLVSGANLKIPLADAFLESLHVDPYNNTSSTASRCIFVPFEWYGHPKKFL